MRILILANNDIGLYKFRKELIQELLYPGSYIEGRDAEPCQVFASLPDGEFTSELCKMGCQFINTPVDRRGMNPLKDLKQLWQYRNMLKTIKPDIVLGYTIKPNIYGALAAQRAGIPFIANITGLGTAVESSGGKQKFFILLYKIAFHNVQRVFFQNEGNRQFFIDHNIAVGKHAMLPGSGVNLERFAVSEYPDDGTVRFLFLSRIMKEKGIDQYLEAAQAIKKRYPNTEFHICGFCEAEYEGKLDELNADGTVIYHGMIREVANFLRNIHCVVHPTYYPEGLSNVLLEACASGRPIITTDRSGCREVVDDGINGYMVPQRNGIELTKAIEKFLVLSYDEKKEMGINGRKKVEEQFDRKIVVKAYMQEMGIGKL